MFVGYRGLEEGVYLVGTGSTGLAETFAVLVSEFCLDFRLNFIF